MSSPSKTPKRKNPYWVALRLLSFRQRSERELFERLKKKKFPEKKIRRLIKDLKEKKFLDDKKFARDFVLYRIETHPEGKTLLKKRLFQKKVPGEIIDKTLEKLLKKEKELELALIAAKKKRNLLRTKDLTPKELRFKISFFLSSRGFSRDVIKETLLKIKI